MPKPRYPAHVFQHLIRYPRKVCRECGQPFAPRLQKPNKGNRRVHLESITKFKHREFCSKSCSNKAHARERAHHKAVQEPAARNPDPTPPVVARDGERLTPARERAADIAEAMAHTTRRLLRDALNYHDELADMFPDRGEA